MEVNKTNTVQPAHEGGGRKPPRKKDDPPERGHHHDERDANTPAHRQEAVAISTGGLLGEELSPHVKIAFDSLTSQVESLRQELGRVQGAEARFATMSHQHLFLPIANRSEFMREVAFVIQYLGVGTLMPLLLVIHFDNGDEIRKKYGRKALDAALSHLCRGFLAQLDHHDVLGSLCGNDFSAILLPTETLSLEARVEALKDSVTQSPFFWQQQQQELVLTFGCVQMSAESNAEDIIAQADDVLIKCQNVH